MQQILQKLHVTYFKVHNNVHKIITHIKIGKDVMPSSHPVIDGNILLEMQNMKNEEHTSSKQVQM